MGVFFSQDPFRREGYRKRFETLLSGVLDKDLNQTARAFNWAFRLPANSFTSCSTLGANRKEYLALVAGKEFL